MATTGSERVTPARERELDLVLYGATGFVGALTAAHLARRLAGTDVRVALAGRSLSRLESLRAGLPGAQDWPLLTADATDPDALRALARRTTVVATTVGPYLRHGHLLARACATEGTHCTDLTGEALYVRECLDQLDEVAAGTGARLVSSTGFDSVPSDLAALLCHEAATADGAGGLTDTTLVVTALRGGVSGGTVDSLRLMVDTITSDPAARRALLDPFLLGPFTPGALPAQPADGFLARRHDGAWVAPFVMAPYNTRVVRRSAGMLGYGPHFRYEEVLRTGRGPAGAAAAAAVAVGVGALAGGLAVPPTRWLLDKVLPEPGEGPSVATQERGHFTTVTTAATTSGARYVTTVAAQGDPGYSATAVMFGEAALALALDPLPAGAGVLTPAVGIGAGLASRLRDCGFTVATTRR